MVKQKKYPTVILAAGGSGGHVFPALALAQTLKTKQISPRFITDKRGTRFLDPDLCPADIIPAQTLTLKKPLHLPSQIGNIIKSIYHARKIIKKYHTNLVVGFGGYPALPTTIAAKICAIPLIIHEQNRIMGRANRLLAPYAQTVACAFPNTRNIPKNTNPLHVGLPIRETIKPYLNAPYQLPTQNQPFNILVIGGSQGAQILTRTVPQALAEIPSQKRKKFQLNLQCRKEDLDHTAKLCKIHNIRAQIQTFFPDIYTQIHNAHLVISRAGASTIAEITHIRRPAILVPLEFGNDQNANAQYYQKKQKALIIQHNDFNPENVKTYLEDILNILNAENNTQNKNTLLHRIIDRHTNQTDENQKNTIILAQEKLAQIIEKYL